MSVIFILIIASLTIAIGFLIAFIWSVKTNQYDDDYTPSVRILFDNELRSKQQSNSKEKNK
ncbi:MAG: cbb3-type cytochrome oxidase assembly protein CcoS [Bacteroidota bacterium]|nr:cbb3-type cytochrome oxidase assembly protein CcoS [Bacteroidota bacterium]